MAKTPKPAITSRPPASAVAIENSSRRLLCCDLPGRQLIQIAPEFGDKPRLQILADRELQPAEKLRRRIQQRQVGAGNFGAEHAGAADHRHEHSRGQSQKAHRQRRQQRRQQKHQQHLHQQHGEGDDASQQSEGRRTDALNIAAHQLRDARVAQPRDLFPRRRRQTFGDA
jgi:hypothetical protein